MESKKKLRIGVGGSAANPVHLGHFHLAKGLLESGRFDRVVWMPCGKRPDKPNLVDGAHRLSMTKAMFAPLLAHPQTEFVIDERDLEGVARPTIDLLRDFSREYPDAEVAWYTGVDSVIPREEHGGKCDIEAWWDEGEELMRKWKFVIAPRVGCPHPSTLSLPPQFETLEIEVPDISSTYLRAAIKKGEGYEEWLTPEVAAYIKAHGLYAT